MTKQIALAITAFILAMTGVAISFLYLVPSEAQIEKLGAIQPQHYASTTAKYYGTNAGSRTATGTPILTLEDLVNVKNVMLEVIVNSTTTATTCATGCSGKTYLYVQGSRDAITWFNLPPKTLATAASGVAVDTINLSGTVASSSILAFEPFQNGETGQQFLLEKLAVRYIRVFAWSTGTSTVAVTGTKLP